MAAGEGPFGGGSCTDPRTRSSPRGRRCRAGRRSGRRERRWTEGEEEGRALPRLLIKKEENVIIDKIIMIR